MFKYEKFEELCKERNVSPWKVAQETNIATATLTEWKNKSLGKPGSYTPKADKVLMIAEYFGVTLDYFM